MLQITETLSIPETELSWTYVRAGGPGGQNVNKVASKAVMRWDLSDIMTVVGEFLFAYDKNVTFLKDDPSGIATRVFERPEKLGFNIIVQSRF